MFRQIKDSAIRLAVSRFLASYRAAELRDQTEVAQRLARLNKEISETPASGEMLGKKPSQKRFKQIFGEGE